LSNTNNLEELEKVIDKWCCEDMDVKGDNFYSKIENKISTMLDKRSAVVNKEKEVKTNDKLNLLEQLNELEMLLQNTKKELYVNTHQINSKPIINIINEEDQGQINFNQIMSMNANHFENNNIANLLTKPIIFDNHYEKEDCNFFISENMFK